MQISPQLSWRSLLVALILVPVAVGVIPLLGVRATVNAFVSAKVIALALAVAATLVLWALGRPRRSGLFLGRDLLPLGAFLLLGAVSTALAPIPRMAFFGDLEQSVGYLVVALCAAAFFLVTQLLRSESQFRELTSVVTLTAAGIAIVGLVQQILLIDVLGFYPGQTAEWMVRRGYSTIGNPDTYAAYLVLPALLAVHRFRTADTARTRAIWGVSFGVILSSCVLAQTRGPLAALAVAGALYAFAEARKRRVRAPKKAKAAPAPTNRPAVLVASIALVLLLAAGIVWGGVTQFASRFTDLTQIAALGGRVPMWQSALEIAAKHPLLGIGPDSFRLGWYPTRTIAHLARGAGLVITDPHNVVLHLAATWGVPALIAALAFVGWALYRAFRSQIRLQLPDYDAWLFGLIALLISLLTSMFALVLIFSLFVGLGVVLAPLFKARTQLGRGNGGLLTVASLAIAAALVAFAGATLAGDVIAVGARVEDEALAAERASQAASVAPWDTALRDLRNETAVNAALGALFTDSPDATQLITHAEDLLGAERTLEPAEYRHYYRTTVLLIGAGQLLRDEYVTRGIDMGLDGLTLYPNSLELRTGLATGFLQLDQPGRAETMLRDVWSADPNYMASGTAYVECLIAQGKTDDARNALGVLQQRFPDAEAVRELEAKVEGQ